jgi:hypothetical protein
LSKSSRHQISGEGGKLNVSASALTADLLSLRTLEKIQMRFHRKDAKDAKKIEQGLTTEDAEDTEKKNTN